MPVLVACREHFRKQLLVSTLPTDRTLVLVRDVQPARKAEGTIRVIARGKRVETGAENWVHRV